MNKILLGFSPIFYPHMGGAERTVYELYSRLIKRHGYEIYLVTLNTENAPEYEILGGIEVYRIGRNYKSKVIKFLFLQLMPKKKRHHVISKHHEYRNNQRYIRRS